MNTEVKEKWIAALVSGKYQQTKGRLRRGNAFCCLGVLCDLNVDYKWDYDTEDEMYYYQEQSNYLPGDILNWTGINNSSPVIIVPETDSLYKKIESQKAYSVFTPEGLEVPLASLNDNDFTFEEIAQLIDRYL